MTIARARRWQSRKTNYHKVKLTERMLRGMTIEDLKEFLKKRDKGLSEEQKALILARIESEKAANKEFYSRAIESPLFDLALKYESKRTLKKGEKRYASVLRISPQYAVWEIKNPHMIIARMIEIVQRAELANRMEELHKLLHG
jgi:hypothetical protein